jgi:hypothetical protein
MARQRARGPSSLQKFWALVRNANGASPEIHLVCDFARKFICVCHEKFSMGIQSRRFSVARVPSAPKKVPHTRSHRYQGWVQVLFCGLRLGTG